MKKLASVLAVVCICLLSVMFVGCKEEVTPRNDYKAQTLFEDMCNAEYFKSITATTVTYKQSNIETVYTIDATTVYVKQTREAEKVCVETWLVNGVEYKATTNTETKEVAYTKADKTYLEKMAEIGNFNGLPISRMQDVVKMYAQKYNSVFTDLAKFNNNTYVLSKESAGGQKYTMVYDFKTGCFKSYTHVQVGADGVQVLQESIKVSYFQDGKHKYPAFDVKNWQ